MRISANNGTDSRALDSSDAQKRISFAAELNEPLITPWAIETKTEGTWAKNALRSEWDVEKRRIDRSVSLAALNPLPGAGKTIAFRRKIPKMRDLIQDRATTVGFLGLNLDMVPELSRGKNGDFD